MVHRACDLHSYVDDVNTGVTNRPANEPHLRTPSRLSAPLSLGSQCTSQAQCSSGCLYGPSKLSRPLDSSAAGPCRVRVPSLTQPCRGALAVAQVRCPDSQREPELITPGYEQVRTALRALPRPRGARLSCRPRPAPAPPTRRPAVTRAEGASHCTDPRISRDLGSMQQSVVTQTWPPRFAHRRRWAFQMARGQRAPTHARWGLAPLTVPHAAISLATDQPQLAALSAPYPPSRMPALGPCSPRRPPQPGPAPAPLGRLRGSPAPFHRVALNMPSITSRGLNYKRAQVWDEWADILDEQNDHAWAAVLALLPRNEQRASPEGSARPRAPFWPPVLEAIDKQVRMAWRRLLHRMLSGSGLRVWGTQ
jgi:hypothetical protein